MASHALHEYPLITSLIGRLKRLSARLGEISELRRMDERQIDQIAREFGLSRTALFSFCTNHASDDLLKQQGLARRRDHSDSSCRAS